MKILVVGGTLFLGRAVVDCSLARGHEVTLFNRGRTNPDLFPEAERLVGDRDDDLGLLADRSFDAVIDPSAYYPRQVTSLIDALGEIGHYTFVSSCSVYADHSRPGADEADALISLPDDTAENLDSPENYGGFKAQCEAALDQRLPGRGHHVRSGLIVGPHDPSGRFTYWVERLMRGGTVLAPEPRDQAVQYIDVDDLAAWIVTGAERGVTGPVNAMGPSTFTMETVLTGIATALDADVDLAWVAEDFLVEHEVAPWSDLPLWLPPRSNPDHAGFLRRDTGRARAAGLTVRPLADTVAATAEWIEHGRADEPTTSTGLVKNPAGLAPERERDLLDRWHARAT